MHMTTSDSRKLSEEICAGLDAKSTVEVIIGPPFTSLAAVSETIKGHHVKLAAQTMHQANEGAFTGEISTTMLRDVGCDYVMLGHSERRQFFGETDTQVATKAKAAHENGLKTIICVGETLDERTADETEAVITRQLEAVTEMLVKEGASEAIVAYEPVWAIGTGKTATPEMAQEVHALIRKLWGDAYGPDIADGLRIQYGGSVKADNAAELLACQDIDGALVGGASLTADSFLAIVRAGEEA